MKRLLKLALIAILITPAQVSAQIVTALTMNCGTETAGTEDAASEPANLHGTWDFLMEASGTPNFGLLSIGFVGDDYGGSLSLWRTAPVVLRKLTVAGKRFRMAVASPDGDVLFDGTLSPKGDRMCGTVTYHGGRLFPAVAQKRPSTYQSQQGPQPASR